MIAENATQFVGSMSGESRDIVMGFDFGTSASKVVLQDPSTRRAFAIPFDAVKQGVLSYLLPTSVDVAPAGRIRLGGSGMHTADLKIRLMDAASTKNAVALHRARALCAAYIALAIRCARLWFLQHHVDAYGQLRLKWWLNLGVPTSSYDDKTTLSAFEIVARAAWRLSVDDGEIVEAAASACIRKSESTSFDSGLPPEQINVYPEVAAEISGYAKSDTRQKGLHLLVDVGASTLDCSTFIIYDNGAENAYAFLQVSVEKSGVYFLHRHRIAGIAEYVRAKVDPFDQVSPIPEHCSDLLPSEAVLASIDELFRETAAGPIRHVVMETKKCRAPAEAQFRLERPAPIPVFICGGGSKLGLYRDLIAGTEKQLRNSGVRMGPYRVIPLVKPEALAADTIADADYHRLAVAYGLSFHYFDLSRVTPPSHIEDQEPSRKVKEVSEIVSKDQV